MSSAATATGRHFRQQPVESEPLPQSTREKKPLAARIGPVLFYIGYALFAVAFAFQYTFFVGDQSVQDTVNLVIRVLEIAAVALVAVKFVIQHPSVYGLILSALLLVVAALSHFASITEWAFWTVIFIVTAEGVDMKKLAGVSFFVTVALLAFELFGSTHGLLTDNMVDRTLSDGTVFVRHSFGLHHPNTFGACLFGACTAFAMMTWGHNPIPAIVLNVAAIVFSRLWLYSRTSMLMGAFEIVVLLLFYFVHNRTARKVISVALVAIAGMAAFVSLFLMVTYDPSNHVHEIINSALSGRISLAHTYFGVKPLSLWGRSYGDAPAVGGLVFLVDDSYCRIVMENGIVPAALFLIGGFGTLIHEVWKGKWSPTLFGLSLMLIYAASELHPMHIGYDFCLVAIGASFIYAEGSPFCHRNKKAARLEEPAETVAGAGRHMA